MKDMKVEKLPGCSWIEINRQVHAFLVGGISPPQTLENNTQFQKTIHRVIVTLVAHLVIKQAFALLEFCRCTELFWYAVKVSRGVF